ncbi:MAG TPA: hypothetical protein VMQ40_00755 [Acidimicrobiales bacterium]|jgi:hypothetical protein|nr:hypothetical protein [Acidimicrobiales bacterium]
MSETQGTSRPLLEVVVAVVLVIALGAIFIGVLGWLAGIFWWLFKLAVLIGVIYLVVRLLLARHR